MSGHIDWQKNDSGAVASKLSTKIAKEPNDMKSNNDTIKIILLIFAPLIFVFVWVGLMYDKLAEKPLLAILLVLGVLVILYGGMISVGPIKIRSRH